MGAPPFSQNPSDFARVVGKELLQQLGQEYGRGGDIGFLRYGVQPPSALYVQQDDFLSVTITPLSATPTYTVSARIMAANGEVIPNSWSMVGLTANQKNTSVFQLREGFLLNVSLAVASGTVLRGQAFAQMAIQPRGATGTPPFSVITSDYVTGLSPIGWPGGRVVSSAIDRGAATSVQQAQPAAGANVTFTVPVAAWMWVKSLNASLTTSATVATRTGFLTITDGTNTLYQAAFAGTQAASLTGQYSAGAGVAYSGASATNQDIPIPVDLVLPAGSKITLGATSIQATDQWTAMQLLVEQWMEV